MVGDEDKNMVSFLLSSLFKISICQRRDGRIIFIYAKRVYKIKQLRRCFIRIILMANTFTVNVVLYDLSSNITNK